MPKSRRLQVQKTKHFSHIFLNILVTVKMKLSLSRLCCVSGLEGWFLVFVQFSSSKKQRKHCKQEWSQWHKWRQKDRKERNKKKRSEAWRISFFPSLMPDTVRDTFLIDPAVILIVVGVVMFFITFCGCIGALRENIRLLKTVIIWADTLRTLVTWWELKLHGNLK